MLLESFSRWVCELVHLGSGYLDDKQIEIRHYLSENEVCIAWLDRISPLLGAHLSKFPHHDCQWIRDFHEFVRVELSNSLRGACIWDTCSPVWPPALSHGETPASWFTQSAKFLTQEKNHQSVDSYIAWAVKLIASGQGDPIGLEVLLGIDDLLLGIH